MILQIIAQDKSLITYRPALREIGGSIAGTVLLQQIMYWDDKCGGKFYKFSEPPKTPEDVPMYRDGDSWTEELGMSAKELRTALAKFAFKCGAKNKTVFGENYNAKRNEAIVQYYTDSNRVTWYVLNRSVLSKLLLGIYKETDQQAVTYIPETTIQENTTEIKALEAKASFEEVWELYRRKGNKTSALKYWKKTSAADRLEIKTNIPAYLRSQPEVKFRRDFSGWINPEYRRWEDEIVSEESKNSRAPTHVASV